MRTSRRGTSSNRGSVLVLLMCCIPILGWTGARVYNSIFFNKDCGGYLKRAADANQVDIAKKQLKLVVDYLEAHNLTQGYTSLVYNTPDEDIAFWYENLRAALDELQKVNEETSQLERSNVLMKLKETLLDDTGNGVSITKPSGIEVYPHNMFFAVFGIFGLLMVGVAGYLLLTGNCSVNAIEIMIIFAILVILTVVMVGAGGV
ncbi:hypothetical protein COT97_05605 [Candidatus Falkowbacteria bacterium CG10_big_fil_rev_8_21_14_0_10_39_11]|uniref:Uncharacterized protein n=1 Tax=Candidatus Falkowbacteria bacterium CG10_big_fil_rev_8_21_14_0_10_39_11 TaxID=1974565 RepID=A0A2H0V3F6_9BACT|nr:MAG: hypothetical protein COT97_05605 [Candidatus Falkowbacteria bacterium CG10_big_fil_rev_8_21_14_0_10_39_11]